MNRVLRWIYVAIVVIHGLIHLMGRADRTRNRHGSAERPDSEDRGRGRRAHGTSRASSVAAAGA